MAQPNEAAYVGVPADSGSILLRRPDRFERCSTEGSEEDLNRRQQRNKGDWGLGFCNGHPVGPSALSGSPVVLIVGPKLFIEPGSKAFFPLSSVSDPGL
jgi:hypothetical protein